MANEAPAFQSFWSRLNAELERLGEHEADYGDAHHQFERRIDPRRAAKDIHNLRSEFGQ